MNKNRISKIMCLITGLLLVVILTPTFGAEQQQKPPELIIGAGSAGGFNLLLGEGVAEAIRRSFRSWSITSSAGEIASNIQFIHGGKLQLTIAHSQIVADANSGIGVYKEPMPDVKIVAMYDRHPTQFVLLSKVPLNSIEEWNKKKLALNINVQKGGSGSEVLNRRVLQAYGITYENIKSWGEEYASRGAVIPWT